MVLHALTDAIGTEDGHKTGLRCRYRGKAGAEMRLYGPENGWWSRLTSWPLPFAGKA